MKKRFELRIEGETAWREGTRKMMHVVVFQPGNPATICKVHRDIEPFTREVDEWPLKAVGTGVCKHGDTYDFETGCRMALKSALRKIDDKELRSKIWKLYFDKFPVNDRKPTKRHVSIVLDWGNIRKEWIMPNSEFIEALEKRMRDDLNRRAFSLGYLSRS